MGKGATDILKILTLILLLVMASSTSAQLFGLDSISVPVSESWDTTCQCYTEHVTAWFAFDDTEGDDTLLVKFGFQPLTSDHSLWVVGVSFADSAGQIVPRAVMYQRPNPLDVDQSGHVSIRDVAVWIDRMWINPCDTCTTY